ncbi:hypothetical protein EDB19DRAFT_1776504 [Suillus lakei]|nr:hypothetical protein EDB19DRAFT_1776504 [Suillus lakei]
MKFTSLTTMIISATAMASVVTASSLDNPADNPSGRPCSGNVGCTTLKGFNGGHDYGYRCQNGVTVAFTACTGNTRCHVTGNTFVCR